MRFIRRELTLAKVFSLPLQLSCLLNGSPPSLITTRQGYRSSPTRIIYLCKRLMDNLRINDADQDSTKDNG